MSTTTTESASAAIVGRIETDTFCVCGYNLHALPVTVDERLKIPICRCPECGRFHAAGKETSANSPWLIRLGALVSLVWFITVVGILGSALVGLAAGQFISIELMYHLRRPPERYDDQAWLRTLLPMFQAGNVLAGSAFGMLVSTLLWHLRRGRALTSAVLPFVAMVVAYYTVKIDSPYYFNYCGRVDFAAYAALQAGGVVAGVYLGRGIVRGVLRVFLPPRLLAGLGFLWDVDGKRPPLGKAGGGL